MSRLNLNKLISELTNGQCEKIASHTDQSSKNVLDALEKTASSNNPAFSEISKIASVLIRQLVSKNEMMEKSADVKELLDDMISSGLVGDSDVEKKASELLNKSHDELAIIREAIKLASGNRSGESIFEDTSSGQEFSSERGMFNSIM